MPEGPSIIILKELCSPFIRRKVITVSGNSKTEIECALGKRVKDFKSRGKHFRICFPDFTIKIHLMLFGSYRINEERETKPRLSLAFRNGVLNFYACSVTLLDGDPNEIYDWSADIMSDTWDPKAATEKLQLKSTMLVCDALLDQEIFAGSGNIIKNEVLFRTKIDPRSEVGTLPVRKRMNCSGRCEITVSTS
jgi:endonuclease-8